MTKTLVLNVTYEPLCVVSSRRALLMVLGDKADLLHATGEKFRSEKQAFDEPSVIRLQRYVRVPFQRRVALSRRAIFIRDDFTCQYCGAAAENIDHVIPRSRGGEHSWVNVVAACKRCNSKKEDHLIHEVGYKLARQPHQPKDRMWIHVHGLPFNALWQQYLNPPVIRPARSMALAQSKVTPLGASGKSGGRYDPDDELEAEEICAEPLTLGGTA